MVNLFQAQELANRFTRYCYYNPTKFHARIYNKIYRILYPKQAWVGNIIENPMNLL